MIYRLAAACVLLLALAFVLPRFVDTGEGLAGATGAVMVFLAILVVACIFSVFLLLRTLRAYSALPTRCQNCRDCAWRIAGDRLDRADRLATPVDCHLDHL